MTILDDLPVDAPDEDRSDLLIGNVADRAGAPVAVIDELPPLDDEEIEERPPVKLFPASVAAFLATAGVGWMLGGIFVGTLPRLIGVAGAFIGAGVVALSSKMRNPTTLQFLALPLGIIVGLVLTASAAGGSSVPTLIVEAVKAGGLSQPPVPFDPGWRFLLVVLTCCIAISAATGAVAFNRSRLSVFMPAPVMVAGVLIQPDGKEMVSVIPALVLLVAALAVAFGGELSRESETGASFEARRLGKAAGFLLVVVAVMVGMSQLGFLYPPKQDSTVIPPKRPQTPPPLTTDKVLFTVTEKEPAPLRLGVLDGYDGTAWLTPPYDPKRYVVVGDGNLPVFTPERPSGKDRPDKVETPARTVEIAVRIEEPGPGREIPDLSNSISVKGAPKGTQFDPRSQTLRLPARADKGTTYVVTAAAPANAAALSAAKTPDERFKAFVEAPEPPPAVRALLAGVPANLNVYERLQAVRTAFYSKITAKGPGNPVDLVPARVDEFLTGTPATPYEITAAEVLMARWAGVPARIGYGYYNPEAKPGKEGRIEVRQSDGAMWLEAYFEGSGWTPILGKPPKAQASLDDNKKKNKQILPNGLISAQLYIPIRQQGLTLLYTIVQFWLVRLAAVGGVVFFFWILLPGMLKAARRVRRRRWAMRMGPRARIAVSYAELRDRAIDFNIGHPTLTPLQFLDVLEPDEDHTQLAWAVSRGLWGDLSRDLRDEDVETTEQWARQLYRRFNAGQPYLMRLLAFGSRVSLRDPWSREMPNLYYRRGPVALLRAGVRALGRELRRGIGRLSPRRMVPALGRASVVLMALSMLSGCVQQIDLSPRPGVAAPLPAIPTSLGDFAFERTRLGDKAFEQYRDIALIADYEMYAVRRAGVAVGTLQASTFKPGLLSRNRRVREGVLTSLGGTPTISKIGGEIFYTVSVNELRLLVWFPRDGLTYQLLAATKDLDKPDDLFARLVAVEQGRSDTDATVEQGAPPGDARRGRF
jgi:transglutaminase-like putative cysteine protease